MNLSKRINWWSRSYKRGEWICPKELTDEVDLISVGEWICPKELTDEVDLISVGNEFVQKN